MGRKVTLSLCTLHQWALDFEGNYQRIIKGIQESKKQKSKFCLFPELCIPGYGCADHFFESDTILHSFQMLGKLLQLPDMIDMICDVGMPILNKSIRYNCRVIFTYKKIILMRPKKDMANEDCYRELRWFTPWKRHGIVEDYFLPRMIQSITGQEVAPFGDGVVSTEDTCIGSEICEELWTPMQTISHQSIDGVEIFTNASGSHHELLKGYRRAELIKSATYLCGGIYLFSNQQGCDGDRLCYDGFSLIAVNGDIVAQGSQFSLEDVECISATVDLEDIRSYRGAKSSRGLQAEMKHYSFPRFKVKDFNLSPDNLRENLILPCVQPITVKVLSAEEEIALGPACWLWDYLRRSGMSGFFLPLSGGVDSASVACIVFSMCKEVFTTIENGNLTALKDLRRIVQDPEYYPEGTQDICNRIFTTCYMSSENSSAETKLRASDLAKCIGSNHINSMIDLAVNAVVKIFSTMTGLTLKYKVNGGSHAENIALQNIQARVRMVLAYLLAGLLPWSRGKCGSLLVLGSSNVDECLRGYFTKYDCSSADLNPIGSISKQHLRSFLGYAYRNYGFKPLKDIMCAPPTAELEPLADGALVQTDEADMGMTYDELSVFGHLRKSERCGPYSMFCKLLHSWKDRHSPSQISTKVKYFFKMYGINRHKMTTLTPAYHASGYSPDDNRYDLRQFLYSQWTWQFQNIDEAVHSVENYPNSNSEVD